MNPTIKSAIPLPKHIAKYNIERVIGYGAKGVVYKAHDCHINRSVAIKVLHQDLQPTVSQQKMNMCFLREARIAARCSHPNIVTLFDFGEDKFPYLVMEYFEGRELKSLIAQTPAIKPAMAAKVCIEMLEALSHAHDKGIIHRDIKPSNILINDEGVIKLSDFGLAHMQSWKNLENKAAGTPNYMSPEALRNDTIDLRTDLFSVGVLFFEMLTRRRPFRHLSLEANLNQLSSFSHIPTSLARELKPILRKALQHDQNKRFQSARSFLHHVRNLKILSEVPQTNLASVVTSPRFDSLPNLEPLFSIFVGPIAKPLIKRYSRISTNIEQTIQFLSKHIPTLDERAQFQELSKKLARELAAKRR